MTIHAQFLDIPELGPTSYLRTLLTKWTRQSRKLYWNAHKTQNTFCVRVQRIVIVETKNENSMYRNQSVQRWNILQYMKFSWKITLSDSVNHSDRDFNMPLNYRTDNKNHQKILWNLLILKNSCKTKDEIWHVTQMVDWDCL